MNSGCVSRWVGLAGVPEMAALHQEYLVVSNPSDELLIGVTVMRPGSATDALAHSKDEFVYVTRGRITAELDGVVHALVEGSHTLLRPGTRHAFRNDSTADGVMLFVFPRGRGDEHVLAGISPPEPIQGREGDNP